VWPSNKFNHNNIVNNSNIITNHVLYVGPSDTVFSQFDIFETSEDMTYTPLTLDEYDIDLNNDLQIQDEFPVLKAGMTKTQTSNRPEQTEAQKEATRLLRQKFKYPAQDPPPNDFQDTRTELQKIQSILRISSQILDQDNLEIWNRVCERSLHLVRQNNSGIPLLRQDISDQIKTYRLQKQQEEDLLQQTQSLNNLRVNKYSELSDKSLVTPSKADSHLSLIDPEASEAPSTPVTDIDCLTTSAAPLPSQNMSTIQYNLWDSSAYSGCRNRRLPNILKSDRYLFDSAVQIILSHLTSHKVMKKYTKLSRLATTLGMTIRNQASEALQNTSVQTSEKYHTMSSSDGQLPVTFTSPRQLTNKTTLSTQQQYNILVVPFVLFNRSKGKAQKFNQNFLLLVCLSDLQK
jgi:hypothetical protein